MSLLEKMVAEFNAGDPTLFLVALVVVFLVIMAAAFLPPPKRDEDTPDDWYLTDDQKWIRHWLDKKEKDNDG